jgi:hypothetical protein
MPKNNDIIDLLKKQRQNKFQSIEKDIINDIYIQCINTIKIYNENNITQCIYEIPCMLPNRPLYDTDDITRKFINILKRKNFKASYISKNKIYIEW